MKSTMQLVLAGAITMASVASAQSLCAVQCFQGVIADHPPLDCKEPTMYHCFCSDATLQNYFMDCAYEKCASTASAVVQYGVDVCAGYGYTLTPPVRGGSSSSAAPPQPETTTSQAPPPAQSTTAGPPPATTSQPPAQQTTTAPAQSTPAQQSSSSAAAQQSSSVITVPTASGGARTSTSGTSAPTPTVVTVNMGASNGASGLLVAAGAAIAAFQML